MTVYAITPTGCRPQGLALLGEYLSAQTYRGPLTWIVVDDCEPATRIPTTRENIEVEVIRPEWRWAPGENTQAACLALGLFRPGFDSQVLILEDDDAYLPEHIENILAELKTADLVGERVSRYYNVASRRYRAIPGKIHASLCSVGLTGWAIDHFMRLCQIGGKMLDYRLWRDYDGPKRLLETHNVVGIKGMPGRPGIGVGHRGGFGKPDTGAVLGDWLGGYADNYGIFQEAR